MKSLLAAHLGDPRRVDPWDASLMVLKEPGTLGEAVVLLPRVIAPYFAGARWSVGHARSEMAHPRDAPPPIDERYLRRRNTAKGRALARLEAIEAFRPPQAVASAERRLPKAFTEHATGPTRKALAADLPVDLPSRFQPVRAERIADGLAVLALGSHCCGVCGKYWLLTSHADAGWSELPLGISGPEWLAARSSRAPLFDSQRVWLEITGRPSPDGGAPATSFLSAALADLRRDSDHDGLTDVLEEEWLGLDPARADSDGDGLDDSADPLPLVPTGPLREPLASLVLGTVVGARPSSTSDAGITTPFLRQSNVVIDAKPTPPVELVLTDLADGYVAVRFSLDERRAVIELTGCDSTGFVTAERETDGGWRLSRP